MSIERSSFSAQNQTLRSYRVYAVFRLQSRHHQLLFKQNLWKMCICTHSLVVDHISGSICVYHSHIAIFS